MTILNLARFTINGTPSEDADGDPGFDATAGQVLTVTLETNPAAGANRVVFQLPVISSDVSNTEGPFSSLFDVPQLWSNGSHVYQLTTPNEAITWTVDPLTDISSYTIRCIVDTAWGQQIYERIVAVRRNGLRMTTPDERQQYGHRGWNDPFNELTKYVAGFVGGGGGGGYLGEQIFFVGKHGSDANDGRSQSTAKATITAAINAAVALVPADNNRFAIVIEDGGIYAEHVTLPSYVNLYAPCARLVSVNNLTAVLTIEDSTEFVVDQIENTHGEQCIHKPAGGSLARGKVRNLLSTVPGPSGVGIEVNSGTVHLDVQDITANAYWVLTGTATLAGYVSRVAAGTPSAVAPTAFLKITYAGRFQVVQDSTDTEVPASEITKYTGAGVTVSNVGGKVVVDIPGGGGPPPVTDPPVVTALALDFETEDYCSIKEAACPPGANQWGKTLCSTSGPGGGVLFYPDSGGNADHFIYYQVGASLGAPAPTYPGYWTLSAVVNKGEKNWIILGCFGGDTDNVWFDLLNGVIGNQTAGVVSARMDALGGSIYRCVVTFKNQATTARIYCADANGVIASAQSANVAFTFQTIDPVTGGPGLRVIQKRLMRVDNRGSLKNTLGLRSSYPEAAPVFFKLPVAGADQIWGGTSGLAFRGISGQDYWIDIADVYGSYDMIWRLHASQKFAFYCVATRHSGTAAQRRVLNLQGTAGALPDHWIGFEGDTWKMARREFNQAGYTNAVDATIPAINFKNCYVGYFDGTAMVVGWGNSVQAPVQFVPNDADPFTRFMIGGPPLSQTPTNMEATLWGVYLAFGVVHGDANDVAIRSYIAARHVVVT